MGLVLSKGRIVEKLLSDSVLTLGISTVGMGLVNNNAGLIGCRFLLGFFEAGIVPGKSS